MPQPQTVPRLDVIKGVSQAKGLDIEYQTKLGASVVGMSEEVLAGAAGKKLRGKVQLVFTSPPFPLNRKRSTAIVKARALNAGSKVMRTY
jgi:hypothetical protein